MGQSDGMLWVTLSFFFARFLHYVHVYVFMWTINIPYSLNLCLYKVVFYFHNIRRKNKPISINMVLLLEVHLIVVDKYYS